MKKKLLSFYVTFSIFCCAMLLGQDSQLQSIEDVISGIDSLLKEIDGVDATPVKPEPVIPAENRPFRAENELMPREFIKEPDPAQSPASVESFSPPPVSDSGNETAAAVAATRAPLPTSTLRISDDESLFSVGKSLISFWGLQYNGVGLHIFWDGRTT